MTFQIKPVTICDTTHLDLLLEADPNIQLIESYLEHGYLFEAILNDKIVGIISLSLTNKTTLEVNNISVYSTYQNQGIGLNLLAFADEFAREHHCKWLDIFTGSTSIGQLYLYQKHGFRIVYVDSDYFIRHYSEKIYENGIHLRDRIALRKELSNI